jgi:hypothetical protein
MTYASLSQSAKRQREASVNGVGNQQSIELHNLMAQTTTKVDFFVVHVVKRSFVLSQAPFFAK